jgi:hypothetical protein
MEELMRKILARIMFLSVLTSAAEASEFLSGKIDAVRPDNYDVGGVFIKVIGTRSGAATCNYPDGSSGNWYFITTNNPMMNELLSVALSAKISDKVVSIVGKGTCTQGYEDVRYIQIN